MDDLAWFEEIDLRPDSPWLRMGTSALRDAPWLIEDRWRDDELALRARLLDERRAEVLAVPDDPQMAALALEAATELEKMIASTGVAIRGEEGDGPLGRLGRSVQEDLCLLRRDTDEWHLAAAVLCFPSRWRLADKIGRSLTEVHGPVAGYDPALRTRITTMLDRLGSQIVQRRNWFIHPDAARFQPDRPEEEPLVMAPAALDGLHLRSERQTLRRLPDSGWIVFTIRIQQATLGAFVAAPERARMLHRFLTEALDQREHRGVSDRQSGELLAAIDPYL